jgi:hypothetical protein
VHFEGCLPVEEIASRGIETLRFGPMKPVGLEHPETNERPHAVVQLRKEDLSDEYFNLVGFQTKMRVPEQQRVIRMIPGLENAQFARFGSMHRNTFINGPKHLRRRSRPSATSASSSPARSPASRATSSPPRSACSSRATSTSSDAHRHPPPRSRTTPPSARSAATWPSRRPIATSRRT